MNKVTHTPEDALRLKERQEYNIHVALEEQEYNDITKIAAQICHVPIALVNLVGENRQWLKPKIGKELEEVSRDQAFCNYIIKHSDRPLVIEDAREESLVKNNQFVTGQPYFVFYAGFPLINSKGFELGTLCLLDHQPRTLLPHQISTLESLANQIVRLLELRRSRTTLTYCNYELEKKNNELEQFAFIAAHDIKSPLNSISSTVNFLMADESLELSESAKSAIKPIDSSARQLRGLVDGILEYSRGDKILLQQKEHFDLSKVIYNVASLFDIRHVHQFIYPKEGINVFANKTAVKQILINLISNALKYNDKPKVVIEIGVSENERYYSFFVKDNGAGVRKEDQLKIFDLFEILPIYGQHQLSNSGIGLATVKKLVDGLGGTVNLESTLGKGSKFEFTIEKIGPNT